MELLNTQASSGSLRRSLGAFNASMIVVGTIIGTGIFLKPAIMAQNAGSVLMVLAAWVVAGLLSFSGALTYAELASEVPESGGEYAYLRSAYGTLPAFLYGWMRFWIASPGSIAAYAVGASAFLSSVIPIDALPVGRPGMAVIFVSLFTAANCLTVIVGARMQAVLTILKVFAIIAIAAVLFIFLSPSKLFTSDALSSSGFHWNGMSSFGSALLAALWAFDGWNNLPMVGEEVRDPKKNLPRALLFGMIIVVAMYLLANLAYFHALDFTEVMGSYSSANPNAYPVATNALFKIMGPLGASVVSVIFVISALGAMNGSILTNARVSYAMSKNGFLLNALSRVSPRTGTPVTAILVQGVLSSILALSGSFDDLTDSVVFASWIFYGLTTSAVFVFRKRKARDESTYRTPGYPYIPCIFIVMSVLLLVNTIMTSMKLSLIGLAVILAGVPVYYIQNRKLRGTSAN